MESVLFQDWLSVGGAANVAFAQNGSDWLECSELVDVVFWLDLKQVSGASVPLLYETAPTRDDNLFMPLVSSIDLATASQTSVVVSPALAHVVANPLARWVRWRISATVAWSATFRIYVTARRSRA